MDMRFVAGLRQLFLRQPLVGANVMTRLTPSVLLTPDPEGMYMHMDEVKKLVREAVLAEREDCIEIANHYWSGGAQCPVASIVHYIRSRNEESK